MNPPPPPSVPNPAAAPPVPVVAPPRPQPAPTPQQIDSGKEQANTRIPLPPGAVIDKYTIISKLGKGGFGITYRAKETETGTIVVIKEHIPEGMAMRMPDGHSVISTSPEKEEEFRTLMAEFMEEASTLMGLEHPGIVPILTAFEANGTAYYAMPFVEGEQLDIPEHPTLDPEKKAAEARKIKRHLQALLFTLEYLEQHNIVHRDIKPENIIVNEENRPILLDFGSARQLQTGKIFNNIFTPDFCAPEQSASRTDAEMSGKLSIRTDIYSLGACFYYLITRLLPPRAETRIHANPDPYKPLAGRKDLALYYEPAFLQSIDRALSLDPRERWQDAPTWRLCTESGIVPPPRSVMLRMRIYMAIAVAIIIILGTLSIIVWQEKRQAQQMYINGLQFTEGLLHDFNTELSDMPGATRLQRKLGNNLKNYLNSMEGLSNVSDAKLQRSLATAWQNMGAVYMQQGELEDATNAYRKATALLEELHEDDPSDIRTHYELARTLVKRADIGRRRNMLNEGRELINRANSMLKEVCEIAPQNPDYRCTMGEAMGVEAQLSINSGDLSNRSKVLEQMVNIYSELYNSYPNHPATRVGLAQAKIKLAILYMDSNNFATAEELLNDSRIILDKMAEENDFRLSILHMRATAYYHAGTMNKRLANSSNSSKTRDKHEELAIRNFSESRSIAKRLVSMDKENAEFMLQLCQSQFHIADIEMRRQNYNVAKDLCTETLHQVNQLLTKAPHNADYATLRAELLTALATILSQNAELPTETQQYFTEARETFKALLEQSPNNPMLKFSYANALAESAAHAYRINEPQTAQAWLQEAEYYLDKLTPLAKDNKVWASRLQLIRNMLHSSGVPGKYNHSENQP